MVRWKTFRPTALAAVALVAAGATACSQQTSQSGAVSQIEDRTFALTPGTAPVKASFLTGELQDLKVTERVETASGKVVDPPKLQGKLRLKNVSEDQAVRLITGTVGYTDGEGKPIRLTEGRGEPSFRFHSYQTERLDPGMETSQSVDVAFPAAALGERPLRNIRLELTYVEFPFREETVTVPLSLEK